MRQNEQGKTGGNKVRRQILQQGAWIFCSTHSLTILRQSPWLLCAVWEKCKEEYRAATQRREEQHGICIHGENWSYPHDSVVYGHIGSGHTGRMGRQRKADLWQSSGGLQIYQSKRGGETAEEITEVLSGRRKVES